VGSVLLIFLVFCVVLLCVFTFYDFCIITMFGSPLPPVFDGRTRVLLTLFLFVLCFCFVCLRLVYPMLPVSLDCPFLIAPSVFSYVYFNKSKIHFLWTLSIFLSEIIFMPFSSRKRAKRSHGFESFVFIKFVKKIIVS